MKKMISAVMICSILVIVVYGINLTSDREKLQRELIRLHVVAHSDSEKDQKIKLRVRDAVLESMREDLSQIGNVEAAKEYLQENLPKIEKLANDTLHAAGFTEKAVVSLKKEIFDTRYYETFSLPAGVYESLRIVIGEGAGKNWWCVAFPALCLPATTAEFEDAAIAAGFSDDLSSTLSGEESYRLRFFLLDAVGKLENILFAG